MSFLQEPVLETAPVATIIKDVIIAALTILAALCMRETLLSLMNYIMPEPQANKLVFQCFLTAFVFLVTIIIASVWK